MNLLKGVNGDDEIEKERSFLRKRSL